MKYVSAFIHFLLCKMGMHQGVCVEGHFRCSHCNFVERYTQYPCPHGDLWDDCPDCRH